LGWLGGKTTLHLLKLLGGDNAALN